MASLRLVLVAALLAWSFDAAPLPAQTAKKPAAKNKAPAEPPRPAGDHGMVLATAMDVAVGKLKDTTKLSDTKNYVFRGKVITLNKERTLHMCFDTELMRVAGVWKGTYPYDAADKNMGPPVEGEMLFTTDPEPGCAKGRDWSDPRVAREGPLPSEWARFLGLYVHNDRTVLAYRIGGADILEMSEAWEKDGFTFVTRTFQVVRTASRDPIRVLLARVGNVEKATFFEEGMVVPEGKRTWHVRYRGKGGDGLATILKGRLAVELNNEDGAIFQVAMGFSASADRERFASLLPPVPTPSLWTKGGPPRWTNEYATPATLGKADKSPYALDLIGLPEKNPWNASVRFGGLDFFPDGRAALSTWDGDVWIVSGLDDKLDKVRWKRFAAGLQHPLGLKIINGVIHTAGRDQITRLHDLNGDGEADFFENFNNEPGLTLQRHEFVMGLETDKEGNLYYGRSGHYILSKTEANCVVYKLTPDGKKIEVFARGFREPNGICIGPDGTMTLGDNEGNGIPQTPIYRVEQGAHYGFTPTLPDSGNKEGGSWKYTEKPIVWLPKPIDGSAAAQVWAPLTWGPLGGRLLHTSYANSALFSLLIDKRGEPWQGAAWRFPLYFDSGLMRARFNPVDGQLYVCGLRGWGTNAVKDGTLARIRFADNGVPIPVGFQVAKDGLEVTFSEPLDRKLAEDDQNWAGTWATNFTSKKEDLPLDSVRLSKDGKTATVVLEKMQPVVNFTLQYRLKSAAGRPASGELHGTIHRVP